MTTVEHNPARLYKGPIGFAVEPFVRLLRGHGLRRNRFVWKTHRALWLLTRSNRVQIAGHVMEVDRKDSLALAGGLYEPEEMAWYASHVGAGDLVVEAGGNVGVFSLVLARQVGPSGRVVTFEPDPDLCGILRRNVASNHYPWIDVREAAVADKPGTLTFYRARKSQGDNRLFSHGVDGATFPVRVVTLDDELAELNQRIDLLKMDIQGAEPLALAGFARTLRDRPPRRMLIEWWPHGMVGMGHDPRSVVDLLRSAGYRISKLGSDEDFDVDAGLAEMTPENLKWVNLVATHATADAR